MKYNAPPGSLNPNAGFVNGIPGVKKGSPISAEALEHPQREIVHVIEQSGLVPDGADLTQLWQALQLVLGRYVCERDVVIYVRVSGNDNNSGLALDSPMKTIEGALRLATYLTVVRCLLTIDVGPGVFPARLNSPIARGALYMRIRGAGSGQTTIPGLYVGDCPLPVYFTGLKLTADDYPVPLHIQYSRVCLDGDVTVSLPGKSVFGIMLEETANLVLQGDVATSGNGAGFLYANYNSSVYSMTAPKKITLLGTPNYSSATIVAQGCSTIQMPSNTLSFVGAAIGVRYSAVLGGMINTAGGATFIPGSIAGGVSTGGQYV